MKKIVLLLQVFLFVGITYAELPAPRDFEFSYHYYSPGESDMCNGKLVQGPEYCSYFSWSEPDLTEEAKARLVSYTIYCKNHIGLTVVASGVTETSVALVGGFMGEVWVTAVYANPDGESNPSNIEFNETLPTNIESLSAEGEKTILYDAAIQKVIIAQDRLVVKNRICIVEPQGKTRIQKENIAELDVSSLEPGIYFVVLIDENGDTISKKIVKTL